MSEHDEAAIEEATDRLNESMIDDAQANGYVMVPAVFTGTKEEMVTNYRTHGWMRESEEEALVCYECGSKAGHAAAYWPCGATVPRRAVVLHEDRTSRTVAAAEASENRRGFAEAMRRGDYGNDFGEGYE